MEYIFIHAKKDVRTEKNDETKNSKEKRELSAKKCWRSEAICSVIEKKLACKKILKKIYVNL